MGICQIGVAAGRIEPTGGGGHEPVTPGACTPWMSWGRGRLLDEPEQLLGARPRTQGWESKMGTDVEIVGVDVSKDRLDAAVLSSGEALQTPNDAAGRAQLAAWLKDRKVRVVGLEPSGGYERDLARALGLAGLCVRVVNPYRLRQYARALGRLAKNDRIDALMIARYTAQLPTREPRCDPLAEQMAELIVARRQLTEDKVRLEAQREQVRDAALRRSMSCRLRRLAAELLLVGKRLAQIIADDPVRREQDRLIQSLPGAGPAYSHTLLGLVPEIGDVDRKGKRHIFGGRAEVRRVAYMAALSAARFNPKLKAYYHRLVASGVARKAAIIAVARRMLGIVVALLRKGEAYDPSLA
ncbi:MAG: transposase [Caulobacter sp.]|nr:transposase [Caulobacter sp.]